MLFGEFLRRGEFALPARPVRAEPAAGIAQALAIAFALTLEVFEGMFETEDAPRGVTVIGRLISWSAGCA